MARILLADGADVENGSDVRKQKPLHLAVGWERYDIALDLIIAGANIDAKNEKHHTPLSLSLWIAARIGSAKMVDLLLRKGADTEVVDELGFVPFVIGAEFGQLEVVRTFLAAGADPNHQAAAALQLALCCGHSEVAQLLYDRGAFLDQEGLTFVAEFTHSSEVDFERFC